MKKVTQQQEDLFQLMVVGECNPELELDRAILAVNADRTRLRLLVKRISIIMDRNLSCDRECVGELIREALKEGGE